MCGLIAVINSDLQVDLAPSLSLLKLRGPDNTGTFTNDTFTFGHTRLSIIDLSNEADQPFLKDGNVIIFNGEIYNYQDLRSEMELEGKTFRTSSDTEVLLEGVLLYGKDFLLKVRGMFAFIIYDAKNEIFVGGRDRFGERPLFYTRIGETFVFCSEFRCLFRFANRDLDIDHNALKLYMHYQFIPEPLTLDKRIKKVPAGSFFTLKPNSESLTLSNFWQMPNISENQTQETSDLDIEKRILELLNNGVARTLTADVPIALSLSAGIDSGAIAALAVGQSQSSNFQAFTLGYKDFPEIDERDGAQKLAADLGIKLHSIEVTTSDFVKDFDKLVVALDEPIADPAAYSHYLIPKQAHDHGFKVLLNGIGGDEFNWGYSWLKSAYEKNENLIGETKSFSLKFRTLFESAPKSDGHLYFYQELQEFNTIYHLSATVGFKIQHENNIEISLAGQLPKNKSEIPMKIQKTLVETWMTSNCLNLADRVGMANSVETRMPFLDADLTDYLNSLTLDNKHAGLEPKYYLKRALKNVLPKYVLEREKTGFRIPNNAWMTAILSSRGEEILEGYFVRLGMLEKDKFALLLRKNQASWHEQFFMYKILLLETWIKLL